MKTLKIKRLNLCKTLLFVLIPFLCFSQRSTKNISDRKDEFKLGFVKIIADATFDIEYERILSNSTSIGSNLVISSDNAYGNLISGYFRFYFNETREFGTEGFFAQPVVGYVIGENDDYDNYLKDENFNAFGMGFAIGRKWINKEGFIYQFSMGGLRTIFGNEAAPENFFTGDIYLGYRF